MRNAVVTVALSVLSLLLAAYAVSLGDFPMGPGDLGRALLGRGGMDTTIVWEWRMPRAVAALALGAALSVAGAIFQTLTRNPLGSPDVLGFSTGAYTGVLLLTIVIGPSATGLLGSATTAVGALAGGIGTAVLVYVLAYRGGVQSFRLIVVGIGAAAFLNAVNVWILLQAQDEVAMAASLWGAGSLSLMDWESLAPVLVLLLIAAPLVLMSRPVMAQLELGDDVAASHGLAVETARRRVLLLAVVLVAAATASAGPIAFVSLAAPQIARRLVRGAGIPLAASAALGAALLSTADLVAHHLLPTDLPVGVITIIIGGAYLVVLLMAPAVQTARRHGR